MFEFDSRSNAQRFAQDFLYKIGNPLAHERPEYVVRRIGAVLLVAGTTIGAFFGGIIADDANDRLNGPECYGETTYRVKKGEGLADVALQIDGNFDYRDVYLNIEKLNPDLPTNHPLQPGEILVTPTNCNA